MQATDDIEEGWENEEELIEDDESPQERFRFTITKGQEPLRIDKYLMNIIEGATRNKIQQAIDEGWVTVNEQAVKSNYKVRPGDEIVVMDTGKNA